MCTSAKLASLAVPLLLTFWIGIAPASIIAKTSDVVTGSARRSMRSVTGMELMATDLCYGLLPEHLLLGTLLALMVLEMCKAPALLGNALVMLALMAAGVVLVRQYSQGYAIDLLPEEIRIDRFALLAKLVIVGSGLAWAFLFAAQATYKSGMLLCSCLLGACIMMDSAGFIPLVLGIEMLSLPAFALMVHGAGASCRQRRSLQVPRCCHRSRAR